MILSYSKIEINNLILCSHTNENHLYQAYKKLARALTPYLTGPHIHRIYFKKVLTSYQS
jgi:hypothetical protein